MERQKDRGRSRKSLKIQWAVCLANELLWEPLVCRTPYENACRPTCDVQEGCSRHTHSPKLMLSRNWKSSSAGDPHSQHSPGCLSCGGPAAERDTGVREARGLWNSLPGVTWAFSERVLLEEATRWPVLYPTEPHLEISPGRPHSLSLSPRAKQRQPPPAWGSDE